MLSSTPADAPWERTTIVYKADPRGGRGPQGHRRRRHPRTLLRERHQTLLAAGKVDRPALTVFPVLLGGGPRLFDDGLRADQWELVSQRAGEHGTLAFVYDRAH